MLYCGAYAKDGQSKEDIYVGYNFYSEDVKLALPILNQKKWYLEDVELEDQQYVVVPAHSVYVLMGKEVPKPTTSKRKSKKK